MFTYIDPTVREKLVEQGKLIRIDADGQVTDPRSPPEPGARAISILGPIPLPIERHGREYQVDWYASVRHTELSKAQELADDLVGAAGLLAGLEDRDIRVGNQVARPGVDEEELLLDSERDREFVIVGMEGLGSGFDFVHWLSPTLSHGPSLPLAGSAAAAGRQALPGTRARILFCWTL